MKNKIYNSLNTVFPDESQKQKMLQNIMKPKEKIGGKIVTLATISICVVFTFVFFSFQKGNDVVVGPRIVTFSENVITYNQKCYQLIDYNGIHLGKKVGYYEEYEVYQLKEEKIVLVKGNVQKMYKECERN